MTGLVREPLAREGESKRKSAQEGRVALPVMGDRERIQS
jgi:hypothetical protein